MTYEQRRDMWRVGGPAPMRKKYILHDPQTGSIQTVYTELACRALVGQGWERKAEDMIADYFR